MPGLQPHNLPHFQEIIETNAKLEKLERLKSEFISIVSHELRTPLTSIKNSLDILTSGRCDFAPGVDGGKQLFNRFFAPAFPGFQVQGGVFLV